jgi:hypothetical protein
MALGNCEHIDLIYRCAEHIFGNISSKLGASRREIVPRVACGDMMVGFFSVVYTNTLHTLLKVHSSVALHFRNLYCSI